MKKEIAQIEKALVKVLTKVTRLKAKTENQGWESPRKLQELQWALSKVLSRKIFK